MGEYLEGSAHTIQMAIDSHPMDFLPQTLPFHGSNFPKNLANALIR